MDAHPAEQVLYDAEHCEDCGGDLYLIDRLASVTIVCDECHRSFGVMTTACRGRSCGSRLIYGGKNGKTPISVHTGKTHFADCPNANDFRRRR